MIEVKEQPDLRVQLGQLCLPNPVMTASGTFGYGAEFVDFVDLSRIGAVIVKGISFLPRPGNPPPRIVETASGMLNAIGLENVGVDRFLREKLPYLKRCGARVVVNILADLVEEYAELAGHFHGVDGIDAIEVNISCPNVQKGGVAFGSDPLMAATVVRAVKERASQPVIVKLSPNVTDIACMGRAVADAGADAISLINTLIGMAVDIHQRKPKLANITGGLSGPAVKPVALRMVWAVSRAVKLPIIGIGGIMTATDVVEFLMAGATAVQVGTASFINPGAAQTIVEDLEAWLAAHGERDVRNLIGAAHT